MTDPERSVVFVLVEPEHASNVGGVARAMANLGHEDLRFVGESQPNWSQLEAARRMAHGALDVLDSSRRFSTLAEAVADRHFILGTSARKREARRIRSLDARLAVELASEPGLAIVLGNERSGLANEHLSLCHEVVSIPTYGVQTSLNLAQAALVVGYSLRWHEVAEPRPKHIRPVAAQIDHTLTRLEEALDRIGFWRPDLEDRTRDHLRRILLRGVESTQELGVLERIAHRIRLFVDGKITPGPDESRSVDSD